MFYKQLVEFVYEILFCRIEIFGIIVNCIPKRFESNRRKKGSLYSILRLSFTHRANALGIFVCTAIAYNIIFPPSFSFIP